MKNKLKPKDRKASNNWKIEQHPMNKDWKDLIIKNDKIKDPVYITITVPDKLYDTLHLLYYKIRKDLKILYLGDIDFVIERKRLPEVRSYLSNYYGSYIKDIMRHRKVKSK